MPPQGPAPQTNGPIHKVPCPHCGKPQDFRELNTQEGTTIYPGTECFCDDCGWGIVIAGVQKVTVLSLTPTNKRDPQWKAGGHQQGQQQRQVRQPSLVQRLLGGGKR